ncbi:MAG: segregation/condensation protein A [Oscillospiraceae bacterium]|nr:segregation/condensation protein A [Oscillospiraceae bacterium]MCL2277840.1 segregation/condensation protein A [Oscillospiraceae bacterium]
MDTPVFKLEGIVKEKDDMSDFEGPLTLILQLLSRNKVEIRDISISVILQQYLAYLDEMTEMNLDIASEFVAMASYLTYIKTKMLLSGGEEVSELEQLITSLEELKRGDVYVQIKEIAQTLSGMYSRDGLMMAGPPEYFSPDDEYKYVHISKELLDAMERVIGRENLKIASRNPRDMVYPGREVFPISNKISEIVDRLKEYGDVKIDVLFGECRDRSELIATFVAVLELCKIGSVLVSGENEDLMLSYTGSGRESEIIDFTAGDS